MKTFLPRSVIHAVALAAPALLGTWPGALRAEEPLSVTAQRLDETAEVAEHGAPAARIGAKFTTFAGSADNATALVTGLHDGTAITLSSTVNGQTTTTTFTPATGKLGYGNTFIALALAQGSLAKAGITSPTPAQIQAALNGGPVTGSSGTAVTLTGVLTLRATGEGWGDIAKTLDLKLGRISHDLRVAENGMEKQNHQGDSSVRVNGQSGERAERVASTPKPDAATRPESSDSGRAMGTARTEGVPRVNLPDVSQMNRPGRH
ncbi:MAG TPA: hypothetical protein VF388_07760 [Lacunisphaera sp.]